ncbi:MAG: hypothetical protein IT379_27220, partial [Deltaproteobacteria bacterium]|nr:hypothetical protein [Deltaproteobacteria bacterium]
MSPGPNVVRCALTQTVSCYPHVPVAGRLDEVRRANVERHVELLGVAARLGAHVVCFGELFTAPYFALREDAMWRDLAEDAERGPTVTELRHAARAQRALVVAPIYELDPSGRRFNTAVVIDEEGEILGKYRKTHIPHGQNEQAAFLEGFYYERSDGQNGRGLANVSRNDYFPVFQTSVARIGVAICYDRHFEGVMSSLAAEGAEIVFSPAVTFGDKSRRMWPLEFEVDAARHRLYIGG